MSKKLLLVLFIMTTSAIAQPIVTDSTSRSTADSTLNGTIWGTYEFVQYCKYIQCGK